MGDDSPVVRHREPDGSRAGRNPGGAPDDVVVVGGGAAGLSAASALRAAGAGVTLVSEGPLGGDCTWHGCVPSKSLLEAAAAGLDAAGAVAHARAVVARVARSENEHALTAGGVRVVRARAVLHAGPVVVLDDGRVLRPGLGVVLATGSRPTVPAGLAPSTTAGAGGPVVRGTDGWLDGLEEHLARSGGRPATGPGPDVVVVGGGSTGVELAQALARLGTAGPGGRVRLLEQAPELLPGTPGAGPVLAAALRADGVDVVTGAGADALPQATATAGLVLLATGRVPALDVLGDGCGVETADGAVVVDAAMATTAPRVRAAGDLVSLAPTTHVAVATGRVAAAGLLDAAGASGAAGRSRPPAPAPVVFDASWVPRVVWTDPQVAAVGQVPGGAGSRAVRLPLSRNDRSPAAAVPGRPDRARGGSATLWLDGDPGGGRVVGALVVGPQAGELVAEAALVGRLGLTVQEWVGGREGLGGVHAGHPYPGWSWTWTLLTDRALGR